LLEGLNFVEADPMVYLKSLLWLILAPGSVAGLVPYLLLRDRAGAAMALPEPLQWLGLGLLGLGAAGLLWCFWDFAAHGKGTPAPVDAPRKLVVRGLYRLVRNPMYVSVLLILLGEVLRFEAPRLLGYAAIVWLAFHLFVVLYEEPNLRRRFGEDYEAYRKRVPRWWPRRGDRIEIPLD
jgi:protein-S-isoprenylcysteine O-methyltransferase Ste14